MYFVDFNGIFSIYTVCNLSGFNIFMKASLNIIATIVLEFGKLYNGQVDLNRLYTTVSSSNVKIGRIPSPPPYLKGGVILRISVFFISYSSNDLMKCIFSIFKRAFDNFISITVFNDNYSTYFVLNEPNHTVPKYLKAY